MFDSIHVSYFFDINHSPNEIRKLVGSPPSQNVLPSLNEARAQANHCDVEGKSPLILAAGVGASNVCQLLLDSKALVDGEKLGYIGKNEAQEEGYPPPKKRIWIYVVTWCMTVFMFA